MAAAATTFPEIDLDAGAPATSYHKVVLTVSSRQDGAPWASQVTTYEHASNAVVAIITGQLATLGSKLGPKGQKPKNQNFDLEISLTVDGQNVLNPSPAAWNGIGREGLLFAERNLLEMWQAMNKDSVEAGKAHGKI